MKPVPQTMKGSRKQPSVFGMPVALSQVGGQPDSGAEANKGG